jgi:hypothetical protein
VTLIGSGREAQRRLRPRSLLGPVALALAVALGGRGSSRPGAGSSQTGATGGQDAKASHLAPAEIAHGAPLPAVR